MISFGLSQKLHDRGLEPEFKEGYHVYRHYRHGYKLHLIADWTDDDAWDSDLPAHQFDQLRTEIQNRGYEWSAWFKNGRYFCAVMKTGPLRPIPFKAEADSPDEAAGEALLRILEVGDQDELHDKKGIEDNVPCQDKFQPLINVIGIEKASEYMYMGIFYSIYLYKHIENREYINVTAEGQFYSYNWKDGYGYLPIESPCSVLEDGRDYDG